MEKFSLANVNNLTGLNVILVSGEGCANCYSMLPVLNNLSSNFPNVHFFKLDVSEEFAAFLNQMNVRTIPSLLLIKDNSLVASCHGYQPEEILEIWLETKIEEIAQ